MEREIISTNTRYPKALHDALVRLAKRHKRSFNAEVMWALQWYVEREEGTSDPISSEKGEHRQDKAN